MTPLDTHIEYMHPRKVRVPKEMHVRIKSLDLIKLAFGVGTIGVLPPVVLRDEGNELMFGYNRLVLAKKLGWKRISVSYFPELSDFAKETLSEADQMLMALAGDFDAEEAQLMAEDFMKWRAEQGND